MSVNLGGAAIVRISYYSLLDDQVAQIDRAFSGLNIIAGALWNSQALFGQMLLNGAYTAFAACIADSALFIGAKLYVRVPGGPPLIDQDLSGAQAGTGGADPLPKQNAALLKWKSSIGGPRGRGRDYMPFPSQAVADASGDLTAGYIANIITFANLWAAGFTVPNVGVGGGTITIRPCTLYTVGTTPPLAFSMTPNGVAAGFATQRRRGFFGKQNRNPF